MSTMPLPFDDDSQIHDDTPLPLIVAKRWNFPLAHVETDDGMYYAVQDWIRGLVGGTTEQASKDWAKIKKKTSLQWRGLPYRATDGKVYKRPHTNDVGLYLIAQYLRPLEVRQVLEDVRDFLADAGAFVDELRLDPEVALTSGAINPDQAIEAAIKVYRAQGKDDGWIQARIEGKIKRNLFTAALSAAVAEMLTPRHFATATDDIYKGLWGRTAAMLKKEMELPKKANLRDHQPRLALHYQGIAEEVSALKLGKREELTWDEARDIVQTVAAFIGKQAAQTADLLQMDIATGKALLPS
jgi:hypothetical protein